jgi:CRISPR-associated protein Csb1
MPRLLIEADLEPMQGSRIQPTGFPDQGPAVYERPDGMRMLIIESPQSVANRLEKVCLDGNGPYIAQELKGLPYVLSELDIGGKKVVTSSLVEAHRLNSPYILESGDLKSRLKKNMDYDSSRPVDWKRVAAAIFYEDPNSLIHGLFMANLEDGRIRMQRALSGFIEGEDVNSVHYGGVKNNTIDPTGSVRVEGFESKDVYSNVPYHREEFSARSIKAYFNLDTSLIMSYGLPDEASDLLILLSIYKVQKFLEKELRLRTACDLRLKGSIKATTTPTGKVHPFELPSIEETLSMLQASIKACGEKGYFSSDVTPKPVMTKKTETKGRKGKAIGPETKGEGEGA